jgi:hypothetical protein
MEYRSSTRSGAWKDNQKDKLDLSDLPTLHEKSAYAVVRNKSTHEVFGCVEKKAGLALRQMLIDVS